MNGLGMNGGGSGDQSLFRVSALVGGGTDRGRVIAVAETWNEAGSGR